MDTMHAAAPTRPRWFAGLRRSRSRLLGGVAGGFAEFWEVDPLLVRVLAASPLLAAMVASVGQVALGLYWTVPVTQLLWLISAGTIAAYLLGWMLIPQPDAASLARRFLAWGGPLGTLAKLTVGFVLLFGFGWLGLGTLGYVGALDDLSPLVYVTGMLVTVGGLATLGVWLARGGDLRDALHRLGSPGFGRSEPGAPAAWVDPAAGDADPTLVL
ncbi:MAG: PspC domain-containing protein, partial [Candidatus Nanopelagicales bacterium]